MDQGASHPNNQYHKTDSDAVWADGFEDNFQGKGRAAGGGGGEGGEEGGGGGASDSKQLAAKKKRLPFVFFKYSLFSSICVRCSVLCCFVLCCSVLSWFIRRHYCRYH